MRPSPDTADELEVKILEIDPLSVIHTLEKKGAELVFDGPIYAEYYDYRNGDHKKLNKRGRTLRLRKKGDAIEFTLKRQLKSGVVKHAEEYEVVVSDFEAMRRILREMQMEVIRSVTKHRLSYLLDPVHFEIETIRGIPPFLEIEGPSIREIRTWVERLGFTWNQAKPWSTKDVLDYYDTASQ